MNNLIKVTGNGIFTDSWIIAEKTGNSHEAIVKLLKKYSDDFKTFGKLSTDLKSDLMSKRGITIYSLNEPQATLLMTFLGNSKNVIDFKMKLVRQFYDMRMLLMEKSPSSGSRLGNKAGYLERWKRIPLKD